MEGRLGNVCLRAPPAQLRHCLKTTIRGLYYTTTERQRGACSILDLDSADLRLLGSLGHISTWGPLITTFFPSTSSPYVVPIISRAVMHLNSMVSGKTLKDAGLRNASGGKQQPVFCTF